VTFRGSSPFRLRGPSSAPRSQASGLRSQVSRFSAGFTLVELLIGASLSAAVLAAVLSSYLFLGRQLARLANQQVLETEARRALGYFTQDVQRATGLVIVATSPTAPAANRLDLTVPTATGTTTVTYYYNSSLSASASVTVNGTVVTMPAASLTRCVYNSTTIPTLTSFTILRNITDGDTDVADNDLLFRYYDTSGNEYTSYTDYLPGIKQVSVEFVTRNGDAANGTQTPLNRVVSSRLVLRNRGFLQ